MNDSKDGAMLKLEHRSDGAAVIWMDDPGEAVNTLKRALIDEFEEILATVESDREIKVLVFASGKPDSFVAGADLEMLRDIHDAGEAKALSEASQRIQRRIAALKPVTVAAIHGACLGGGLELALAFDGRIASNHDKTRLGLPEVQLGLLPGGGGTQRLPRLVGIEKALDLLLTGRQVNAGYARRIGLVDDCVHRDIVVDAAIQRGREIAARPRRPSAWHRIQSYLSMPALRNWALGGNPLGRRIVIDQARKRTNRKTRGNYPAPERILLAVKTGLESGIPRGEAAEAAAFGDLVVTPEARQLIGIFFASNELKKDTGVDDEAVEPVAANKLGVLGAGLMGAGIAYVSAAKAGASVRLKDINDDNVARGLKYVRGVLDAQVKRRSIKPLEADRAMSRVTGTLDYSGFANCDVVVEAVFEDMKLKRKMIEEVEKRAGEKTIFATNTSALPIGEIAADSKRPENIIGMHYFSPVEKMPLLEVVMTENTAPWVTATCVALGKRQGKTVIVVRDGPGFYTSRILGPYMNEAAYLLAEGAPVDRIDGALKDFGYPVGPMALLDEVGIDVGQKVANTLAGAFGDRMAPAPGMDKLAGDDRLGKKNRRGLYLYKGGKKDDGRQVDESVYKLLGVSPRHDFDRNEITERCVLQMVNEAAWCLAEGIIKSTRDGDIGAVFGLGFPPFRGGPFRYIDSEGADRVVERLKGLEDRFGERFKPASLLVEYAQAGRKFYGTDD
ncbi:MAG: fatty acid oxidation complex subunit alpha FadJ [Gammaproteobacteria bacterium]|nr:fatty acid oxidation complex subunit alpha FadJ [Gammaproteobacteria bacterium]